MVMIRSVPFQATVASRFVKRKYHHSNCGARAANDCYHRNSEVAPTDPLATWRAIPVMAKSHLTEPGVLVRQWCQSHLKGLAPCRGQTHETQR